MPRQIGRPETPVCDLKREFGQAGLEFKKKGQPWDCPFRGLFDFV
jgi:hypothetical protein